VAADAPAGRQASLGGDRRRDISLVQDPGQHTKGHRGDGQKRGLRPRPEQRSEEASTAKKGRELEHTHCAGANGKKKCGA